MPRAIVFQIIVLATLTSCAAISGLADKEAVDCPGDCADGSLPPRNDDASTGAADAGDANVVDAGVPKCDPKKDLSCIAQPDGWSFVSRGIANIATPGACSSGTPPVTVKELPLPQANACSCDTCTVTTPATCSGQLDHEFATTAGCSFSGDASSYENPVAGTCYRDLFTGSSPASANRFVLPNPSGGVCTVIPTPHSERVNYALTYALCDEASRCSGGFCDAQITVGIDLCFARDGDVACPEGFSEKHVVGTDGADFDCGTCACNLNRQPCQGAVNHYTDANCTNGLVVIPANGQCGGPDTKGTSFGSYKVVATAATTCNTGGSVSASNARMKNPRTVCCRN